MSALGLYRTAAAFAATGVLAVAAGRFLPWECGIEGAYFDRSVGESNSVITQWGNCDVGYGLVGAGVALIVCALIVGVLGRRVSRREAS